MWDDEPDPDGMYISPLSVNLNTISVRVSPGEAAGMPAVVSVSPRTTLVKIDNRAVTGFAGPRGSVKVTRNPGDRDNLITISGTISLGASPTVKRLTIWKPELFALGLFSDALRARGITITKTGIAGTPPGIPIIARKGRPVGDLVRFMLKKSDNLSAESLLKYIALETTRRPGSADSGSRAVLDYLKTHHVPVDRVVVADGSGLSRYNLTNPDTIIRLLEEVYRDHEIFPLFYDSLPIAGKDGTLAARMKGTAAEGKLRGKTGTMRGISALSGYLSTAEEEPLAFSIIIQNYAGPPQHARDIQDRIGALLCSFRRQ
jgi:D-alanyl-D-alanine carboxypeptidase/D-alanyl-D-alanine-endopeptidase (penicillin-binding protein 4)